MSSKCSRIRRDVFTWVTYEIMLWVMLSRVINGHRASTSCTRWGGMPLACPQRTLLWSRVSTPGNGHTKISRQCGPSCKKWGSPSTGRANSPPVIRAITKMNKKCSLRFWSMISFTAGGAGLIGTRSTTPFSQTSRLLTEWDGDPALRWSDGSLINGFSG